MSDTESEIDVRFPWPVGTLCWHVHHSDLLCEILREPATVRVRYIIDHKPLNEHKVRLDRFRPVRQLNRVPCRFVEASATLSEAHAAWSEANAALSKAKTAWSEAYSAALPLLTQLHAEECPDCPWDGKTIFPDAVTM